MVVERPILVTHWSEGDDVASFPHTLVVADEGAEVTVAEYHASASSGPATWPTPSSSSCSATPPT